MISFFLPIIPAKATSQGAGKRILVVRGRPMFFKSKQAKEAEGDLMSLCAPYAPEEPLQGAVALYVDFTFPWRKSEPKRRIALGRVPHTSRPDCSNLIKMIEDVMTKLRFWTDDSCIAQLSISKAWGDKVGISVQIRQIAEN